MTPLAIKLLVSSLLTSHICYVRLFLRHNRFPVYIFSVPCWLFVIYLYTLFYSIRRTCLSHIVGSVRGEFMQRLSCRFSYDTTASQNKHIIMNACMININSVNNYWYGKKINISTGILALMKREYAVQKIVLNFAKTLYLKEKISINKIIHRKCLSHFSPVPMANFDI